MAFGMSLTMREGGYGPKTYPFRQVSPGTFIDYRGREYHSDRTGTLKCFPLKMRAERRALKNKGNRK